MAPQPEDIDYPELSKVVGFIEKHTQRTNYGKLQVSMECKSLVHL